MIIAYHLDQSIFSGLAKSNRIGFSNIPGSPQEAPDMQESIKPEPMFPLSANPSVDNNENQPTTPMIDEQEALVNSEDEDEPTPMPVDEAQAECN